MAVFIFRCDIARLSVSLFVLFSCCSSDVDLVEGDNTDKEILTLWPQLHPVQLWPYVFYFLLPILVFKIIDFYPLRPIFGDKIMHFSKDFFKTGLQYSTSKLEHLRSQKYSIFLNTMNHLANLSANIKMAKVLGEANTTPSSQAAFWPLHCRCRNLILFQNYSKHPVFIMVNHRKTEVISKVKNFPDTSKYWHEPNPTPDPPVF